MNRMKNKLKKGMALLLATALVTAMLPIIPNNMITVQAAESVEYTTTGQEIEYVNYNSDSEAWKTETLEADSYQLIDSSSTTWSDGWYVVGSDITISDCVTVSGNVNLLLTNSNTLTCSSGINVAGENSLTIYGQSGDTGILSVTGLDGAPGIGAISGEVGTITINGGTVNANGSFEIVSSSTSGSVACIGSGLGGAISASGSSGYTHTTGGSVIINGGKVTASGGGGFVSGYTRVAPGILASFSTCNEGKALIKANSISDTSDKDNWSGIIYEAGTGAVYGSQTLVEDYTIEEGETLYISSGMELIVPAGINLVNNGTLIVSGGTLEVNDDFSNNNTFKVENGGNVSIVGEFANTKNVEISGLLTCGTINNTNLIEITADGTLVCNGGTNTSLISNEGTLTNTGTITGEGGVIVSETDVAGADGQLLKNINYINEQGEIAEISSDCSICLVTTTSSTWQKKDEKDTWYIVAEDVTINNGVKMMGDINLLLMDGATLTVNGINDNGGINGNGYTLNIFAQSTGSNMGKVVATGGHYNWMAIGGSGTTINIYGGIIDASNEDIGGAAYQVSGQITISRGIVKANRIGRGTTVGTNTGGLYGPEGGSAVVYTEQTTLGTSTADTFHGILFLQNSGTVYGDQSLTMDLTIEEDETLTVPVGTTLTIPEGLVLTVKGTLIVEGLLENNGSIINEGIITNNGAIYINMGSSYTGTEPKVNGVSYQILWDVDGDGNSDDTTYVLSGQTPTHSNSDKEPTVDTVYTFTGWSPMIEESKEPIVYTAQFQSEIRRYDVVLPESMVGYTITTDDELSVNYGEIFEFGIRIMDGYTATDSFDVKVNGTEKPIAAANGKFAVIVTGDTVITVEGVADVTAPNVEIKVKENGWTQFLDTITFGILFKETQDVTVTASDVNTGSGIDKVYYYISDKALSEDEVKALTSWTEYDKKFSITLDNTYVIYVKAVDKAGNETYASTDGMVLDGTSPIITGIEQNGVYYAEATFGATDTYLDKVLVDDEEITLTDGSYTIYADDKEHTIKATDKVGNEVSYTITVKYGVIKNYVTGYEGTYDGQTHSITVTVDESSYVKITYSTDEGETKTYSDEKPVFTEAGEYTVYYKLEKDNYTAVYGSETVKISKRELTITAADQTISYGDSIDKTKYTVTGLVEGHSINAVTLTPSTSDATDNGTIAVSIERIVNASGDDIMANYDIKYTAGKLVIESQPEEPVEYEITDGANSKWTINSDGSITIRGNGDYAKFVGVKVDGTWIDEANYTVKSGSTIITLKNSYLNTLSAGTHTFEIVWTDGSANTTFTVEAVVEDDESVILDTGDNTPIGLCLMLLIGSGLTAVGFWKKKKYIVEE